MPFKSIAFVGLLILSGLVLSMRFEYKFKNQLEDLVAGYSLYNKIFSNNAQHHWK